MTYTEIKNEVYKNFPAIPVEAVTLDSIDLRAWRVLETLEGRKGFRGWWEDIRGDDIKDDIFNALKDAVR